MQKNCNIDKFWLSSVMLFACTYFLFFPLSIFATFLRQQFAVQDISEELFLMSIDEWLMFSYDINEEISVAD